MDANNIDENMTVPHPSKQQTTTSLAHAPMDQHLGLVQQHYNNHREHQLQHNYNQLNQFQQQQQQHHQFHNHQQQQYLQSPEQNQHYSNSPVSNQEANDNNLEPDPIAEQLQTLILETQRTEEAVKASGTSHEEFALNLQERTKQISVVNYHENTAPHDLCTIETAKKQLLDCENLLRAKATELKCKRRALMSHQRQIFEHLTLIQNNVLFEYLPKWHQDQQLGRVDGKTISQIQRWVEMLTDITWRLRNQLKGLHHTITVKPNIPPANDLEELDYFGLCLNRSLETLILNTFVVEKQPPQVMKTNTRFTSTVRFLSGARLGVQLIRPAVKVTIMSESNARAIIQRHQELIQASWAYLDCPNGHQSRSASVNPIQAHSQGQQVVYSNLGRDNQGSPMTPVALNGMAHQANFLHQQIVQRPLQPQQPVQPQAPQQSVQHQQGFFQPQQTPHHVQQVPTSGMNQYQNIQQRESNYFQQKIINLAEFDPSGEILNNSNRLEYQEPTLMCHFRNMQLKKIKRTEKKGTESVMDEKFILLFHTQFRIAESYPEEGNCSSSSSWMKQGDLSFHIMAFSLPVVVIVHGNQEPHAWATVTWHNAFARPDELLYSVPDKVCWRELGQVLSEKFEMCAGKGLSAHNLDFLASKVYRNPVDSENVIVTWNQFAKEPLPERTFTFWEWFHSILKLTKDYLRELWKDDKIYGFVGKKGCADLLLGSSFREPTPLGTFLLRYSETELGGITIAWVGSSQVSKSGVLQIYKLQRHSPTNSSSNVLMHLQPFVSKDLNTRSLADRIRDLEDLVLLYPDIPKDEALQKYYSPINDSNQISNGYIKPMLIQTLVTNYPKNPSSISSMDCAVTPATPNSFSQSSPEGIYQDNAFMNDVEPTYATYEGSSQIERFSN